MDFTVLTAYLDSLMATYGIPAADCAIYYRQQEVYRHMAGFADEQKTRSVTNQDVYFMYSATKVITCTAVMQLVERGMLALEAPLSQYIPEFAQVQVLEQMPDMTVFPFVISGPTRPARTDIRIHHLLSMTSGISYDLESEAIQHVLLETGHQAGVQQLVRAMAKQPLLCDPGEHWVYGLSHDVLAAVVEIVSGMPFADFLQANIFAPLGMTDIFWRVQDIPQERISEQYAGDMQTGLLHRVPKDNRYMLTPNYQSGGAGIACTVDAYGKLVSALSNNGLIAGQMRILSEESIRQMQTNRLSAAALVDFRRMGKFAYGYGLGVRTLMDASTSKSPVGEFGWDGAAGAYVLIDPTHKLGIMYAQHTLMFPRVYSEVHPQIRDLTYTALGLG